MRRKGLHASVVAMAIVAGGCRFLTGGLDELPLRRPERLLVFSPHPDDEAIAVAGLIQRVVGTGGTARVVLMTSGDAFEEGVKAAEDTAHPTASDYRRYGRLREGETIEGMQRVGVSRANITFLGFPDGVLCLIATAHRERTRGPLTSPSTGRDEPPVGEQVIRGTTYRGADLRRELAAIMASYDPTLIAVPYPDDRHPDHCATSIFVREVLGARAVTATPRVLYFLIHHDGWPDLHENAASTLRPPADIPAGAGRWRTLTMTSEEAAIKRGAIAAYASQKEMMPELFEAFSRPNELFFEGHVTSTRKCWCDDTHVATEVPPGRDGRRPQAGR